MNNSSFKEWNDLSKQISTKTFIKVNDELFFKNIKNPITIKIIDYQDLSKDKLKEYNINLNYIIVIIKPNLKIFKYELENEEIYQCSIMDLSLYNKPNIKIIIDNTTNYLFLLKNKINLNYGYLSLIKIKRNYLYKKLLITYDTSIIQKNKYSCISFLKELKFLKTILSNSKYNKISYLLYIIIVSNYKYFNIDNIILIIIFYSNNKQDDLTNKILSLFKKDKKEKIIEIKENILNNFYKNKYMNVLYRKEIIEKAYQLKYLKKMEITLFQKDDDYKIKLKDLIFNYKSMIPDTLDLNIKCQQCSIQGHFIILLNEKFNLCKICFNDKFSSEEKKIKKEKIVSFEDKLIKNGWSQKEIYELRMNNQIKIY